MSSPIRSTPTGDADWFAQAVTTFDGIDAAQSGAIGDGESSDASSYGLMGLDAQPGANPDNDPFINALELLLGLDPTMADAPTPSLYEVVQVGNEIRINFTIDPSLNVAVNGDSLDVSAGGEPPLSVTGQTGQNLVNDWANQLPSNVSGSIYRATLPMTNPGNGVIRLQFMTP